MKSRAINTTKDQDEFRVSILKKSVVGNYYKKKYKEPISILVEPKREPIPDKLYYMDNCIFLIQEYSAGRCTKERCLKAIASLSNLCHELNALIK